MLSVGLFLLGRYKAFHGVATFMSASSEKSIAVWSIENLIDDKANPCLAIGSRTKIMARLAKIAGRALKNQRSLRARRPPKRSLEP